METVKILVLRIIAIILALLWIIAIVILVTSEGNSNLFLVFFAASYIGGPIVAYFLAGALWENDIGWAAGAFFFPVIALPILAFKKGLRYYKTPPRKTQPTTSYVRPSSSRTTIQKQATSHGRVRCSKCGTNFDVSIVMGATGKVKVLKCRACPVDAVFAVCERCADLDQVQKGSCPSCKADNLWEIDSMLPV